MAKTKKAGTTQKTQTQYVWGVTRPNGEIVLNSLRGTRESAIQAAYDLNHVEGKAIKVKVTASDWRTENGKRLG